MSLIEQNIKASENKKVRTEEEIRKRLAHLENKGKSEGPFTELENIARKAAKRALEWVLEETDNVLTY